MTPNANLFAALRANFSDDLDACAIELADGPEAGQRYSWRDIDRATEAEKNAILQYASFRDECTYPDVKVMLNELILLRQKSIAILEETRHALRGKFDVLDQISEGFNL